MFETNLFEKTVLIHRTELSIKEIWKKKNQICEVMNNCRIFLRRNELA
jgi:hypothetical protein